MARKPKAQQEAEQKTVTVVDKQTTIPAVDDPPEGEELENTEPIGEQVQVPLSEYVEVTLKIPFDPTAIPRAGYISRRADLRVNRKQAEAVRCVSDALSSMEAGLADGREIRRRDSYAILWIIDQLATAIAESAKT